MNPSSLLSGSLRLVALLAIEVTLITLATALVARWCKSAAWARTFWQAAFVSVLVLTGCELSGAARWLSGRMQTLLAQGKTTAILTPQAVQPPAPQLSASFRSEVEARLSGKPALAERQPTTGIRAVPSPPAAATEAISPTASDSLNVLSLWLVWVIGASSVLARAWIGRSLLLVFRLRRPQVLDPVLIQRVRNLSLALGFCRQVRLFASARLSCPMAFGVFQPAIGVPTDFLTRFSPAQQDAMLAHELAHLAARDPFWSLVTDFSAALLWWHPAIWWARRELHRASELAADEASLVLNDGPAALAECLLDLGGRLVAEHSLGQLQVSGFRSHLGRRIQRLLGLESRPWSPPPRMRAALLLAFGPLAMAAFVVLGTAWAAPKALTKGNNMQTAQLTLKRSLATFALLAAFTGPDAVASGAESGDSPAAPATAQPVVPAANSAVSALPSSVPAIRSAQNSPADNTSQSAREAFLRRYGLQTSSTGTTLGSATKTRGPSPKRENIEAKLNEITLSEIQFDGLPLSEAIKVLSDQSIKLDPVKKGINFLINYNVPPVAPTTIDPTTGLPVTAPAETIDVGSIMVKFSLPLRNVSLKDTLEAVMRVAERPIEYSVEEYGVVVSVKSEQPVGSVSASTSEDLVACTFKVDTNTFVAGLENAFGITVPPVTAGQSGARVRELQTGLRTLLTQLGVSPVNARTVFYNDLTGILMVRATPNEEGLIQAAIETLGGQPIGSYPASGGPGLSLATPGHR